MTFSVKLLFQAAVIAQKSLIGNRSIDTLSSKIPNILFSRFFPNSYAFDSGNFITKRTLEFLYF